jgi:hypothetical protein
MLSVTGIVGVYKMGMVLVKSSCILSGVGGLVMLLLDIHTFHDLAAPPKVFTISNNSLHSAVARYSDTPLHSHIVSHLLTLLCRTL